MEVWVNKTTLEVTLRKDFIVVGGMKERESER